MNIVSMFSRKQSNFKAGGLIITDTFKACRKVARPAGFIAPRRLDFRDMCLKTDDQGSTSSKCAAYSSAGHIEVHNWRIKNIAEQIDPNPIYKQAKAIDKDPGEGTTLDAVSEAVLKLNLIKGKPVRVEYEDIKFAIHKFTTFVGGFFIDDNWNYVSRDGAVPSQDGRSKLGGHAVLCCGYDDEGLYIQNSWGTAWGLHGFCKLPWRAAQLQYMYGYAINTL